VVTATLADPAGTPTATATGTGPRAARCTAAAPLGTARRDAVAPPPVPALVVGTVTHTRRTPLEHTFTYRHYQWLVDVADLPQLRGPRRWLAGFDARDHLDGGRLGGGIRGDVVRFCASRGVHVDRTDRVLMLAHARVLGHTFDPMTAFWVLRDDGTLRTVVVEVHNTYGGRHAYLVDPDERGRATVAKAFYVSPFTPLAGTYAMHLLLRPDRVAVAIGLDVDGARVLDAAVDGKPVPATPGAVVRIALRHLPMTWRVTALIRVHGIVLWLRRLPVQPGARRTKDVS